jgi:hypothetical protein
LLTTCVYRDLHGSRFHYQWAHNTKAHNAVLVNGEGQIPHTAAPHGRIVEFRASPEWDYVEGDATAAYGNRLTHYRRKIVFVKPHLIVICDDLAAPTASSFQFLLHALRPFTVDAAAARLVVEQSKAGVDVHYLTPVPLVFRQWDGYEPKPDKEFPNQWHVEAGTAAKRDKLQMLTVIVPYRAGARVESGAERLETDSAIGARVRIGGRSVLAAFRKTGVEGPCRLDGEQFDQSVFVRSR